METVLEPTGEETVLVRVRDSSPAEFTTEDIYDRRMDRGLGVVTAALGRYEGTTPRGLPRRLGGPREIDPRL